MDSYISQFSLDANYFHSLNSRQIKLIWVRRRGPWSQTVSHGPLARYVKLCVAHAPEMPGTFSPPLRISYPDMHHGTCVTHVPWCMSGSLTSSLFWNRWREKRSRHSRNLRNPQFNVSDKRPICSKSKETTRARPTAKHELRCLE